MQALANWYASGLGTWMPAQLFVSLVSMIPLVELRGGIVVARLLSLPLWQAITFSVIGNIIPIPFILLFIKKIFAWMKKKHILTKFVAWCERRAEKKSKGKERGIFIFLLLFVAERIIAVEPCVLVFKAGIAESIKVIFCDLSVIRISET